MFHGFQTNWVLKIATAACVLGLFPLAAGAAGRPDQAGNRQVPEIFVQLKHTKNIKSMAVSPDGRYFISASQDKTIKLLDLGLKKEIRTIIVDSEVQSIAFSPDGNYVATGDQRRNLFVWDFRTWNIVKRLKLPDADAGGSIVDVTFMPDGRHILSSEFGHFLYCWDILKGTLTWKLRVQKTDTPMNYPAYIALSPDGKRVAVASHYEPERDKTVSYIDIFASDTKKRIAQFPEIPDYEIRDMAYSPDEKYIAATASFKGGANADGSKDRVFILDVRARKILKECPVVNTWAVSFSRDGRYFAVFGFGDVRLFDAQSFGEVAKLDKNPPGIFSQDSRQIIMGNKDEGIDLYDIDKGAFTDLMPVKTFGLDFASYDKEGGKIVASGDGLFQWDMETSSSQPIFIQDSDGNTVHGGGATIDDKNKYVVDGYGLRLWDLKAKKRLRALQYPEDFVTYARRFSPDGRYLVAGSYKGEILAFDLERNGAGRMFPGKNKNSVKSLAFSPDGRFLFSGADEEIIKWDMASGGTMERLDAKHTPHFLDVSADSKFLLSGGIGENDSAILWDVHTGKKKAAFAGHCDGEQGCYLTAGAFSGDGKLAVTGDSSGIIKVWDVPSGREVRTFKGHSGEIKSARLLPDGKRVLSASKDGTARLWDIATGKAVVQFIYFTDGQWIAITPDGYFNASPDGAKHLSVRVGNQVYSIDNFYEKFFNPVHVASVLQGKTLEAAADIRKGILSPPEVRITSPAPGSAVNADTLTVTVAAKDTGGGIDEIRLYHNGKAIGDDTRGVKIAAKGNEAIRQYTVSLVDGANSFRATGFSKDRTESNPHELTVILSAPAKDVSLHILAVGINQYKNPALNLNYAQPDARGIADFFRQQGRKLFKDIAIDEIYNDQATRENILSRLSKLQSTNPQDVVLLYLAGHGENINDKWYFIPHELTYPEREEDVKAKGLSSDELSGYIKNIRAQKILLLVDACKSGAVLVAFRGFEDRKALSQLSRSTGVHIVAASTKDQFAAEVKDLGHGVFTYTLLEGLRGKAAGRGEPVTVRKLMGYVEEQLPEITKKYKQEAQYPVVDSRGMDFPLAVK